MTLGGAWVVALLVGCTQQPIEDTALVADKATASRVRCWIADGTGVLRVRPEYFAYVDSVASCEARGGAVWGSLPSTRSSQARASASTCSGLGPTYVESQTSDGPTHESIDASGIAEMDYSDPEHDCDDFADELEQWLEEEGFHATFTALYYHDEQGELLDGHAITDTHDANGETSWWEPQTGDRVLLDLDGDGDVDTRNPKDRSCGPTEGDVEVIVFESLAEAEGIGYRVD